MDHESKLAIFQNLYLILVADGERTATEEQYPAAMAHELGLAPEDCMDILANYASLDFVVPPDRESAQALLNEMVIAAIGCGSDNEVTIDRCYKFAQKAQISREDFIKTVEHYRSINSGYDAIRADNLEHYTELFSSILELEPADKDVANALDSIARGDWSGISKLPPEIQPLIEQLAWLCMVRGPSLHRAFVAHLMMYVDLVKSGGRTLMDLFDMLSEVEQEYCDGKLSLAGRTSAEIRADIEQARSALGA